jgi:chromate transporter
MHDTLVEREAWVSNEHFFHALSHCMLLPGPEAQQLAIYLGWKLHGIKGGIIAGSLFVLPSMFLLLLLSFLYARFGTLPWITAIFFGLKPGVLALVLTALFRVMRRSLVTPTQWVVAAGAFIAMVWLHCSIPVVMLATIMFGLLQALLFPHVGTAALASLDSSLPESKFRWLRTLSSAAKIFATGGALWIVPMFALYYFCWDFAFWTSLSLFFTRAAFVTLGGSYTVIPYVAHAAVANYQWLNHSEMLDGFALAETTPGPLIIVVAFVGFMAAFHHFRGSIAMGTVGLLVTTFYTFLPCFLFVFAGRSLVERSHGNRVVRSVLQLISAVVIAAMLNLALFLGRGVLFASDPSTIAGLDWVAAVWAGLMIILLLRSRMNLAGVLILSAGLGLGRWFFHM